MAEKFFQKFSKHKSIITNLESKTLQAGNTKFSLNQKKIVSHCLYEDKVRENKHAECYFESSSRNILKIQKTCPYMPFKCRNIGIETCKSNFTTHLAKVRRGYTCRLVGETKRNVTSKSSNTFFQSLVGSHCKCIQTKIRHENAKLTRPHLLKGLDVMKPKVCCFETEPPCDTGGRLADRPKTASILAHNQREEKQCGPRPRQRSAAKAWGWRGAYTQLGNRSYI